MTKNNGANILGQIVLFVGIVFLLLGVLFGAQIFTFIFGSIGQANVSSIPLATDTRTNLSVVEVGTDIGINLTGFIIPEASNANFTGGVVITAAFNITSDLNAIIPLSDIAVNALTGNVTNATTTVYNNVSLSYTFSVKTQQQIATENVNNNSINSIVTYTEQADTQLNTAAIAITLLILIALFLVFWVAFIRPMMQQSSGKNSGGNFSA